MKYAEKVKIVAPGGHFFSPAAQQDLQGDQQTALWALKHQRLCSQVRGNPKVEFNQPQVTQLSHGTVPNSH